MNIEQSHFSDISSARFDAARGTQDTQRRLGFLHTALGERHVALRARFANHGAETLSDAEMLELLLLRSKPRSDTRPLTEALLSEFGDLAGILAADADRLEPIIGITAAQDICLMRAASKRLARARIAHRPLISSWDAVLNYCRTSLAHKDTEEFHVLFLDRRNMLIADEVMGIGTVDHVPVYPREVFKRALKLNACALIIVHNHPSGDPSPSPSDIEMTKALKQAAEALSITLHDHLIIGASGTTSFVSEGLL